MSHYNATAYGLDEQGRIVSVDAVRIDDGCIIAASGFDSATSGTPAFHEEWLDYKLDYHRSIEVEYDGAEGYRRSQVTSDCIDTLEAVVGWIDRVISHVRQYDGDELDSRWLKGLRELVLEQSGEYEVAAWNAARRLRETLAISKRSAW